MLFNSYEFIFTFLPIAFIGYLVTSRASATVSAAWLVLCSLAFYGVWNAAFLTLLIGSIVFNYLAGNLIAKTQDRRQQVVFIGAVTANLSLLVFFKYLGPTLEFAARYGLLKDPTWLHIILPLGISFFTFTQIGYLVDRRDGLANDLGPVRYALFVSFFPHLIAGPILHVREIGPQLLDPKSYKPTLAKIAPGLTLFALGLAKKVLIADPLAGAVAAGFANPAQLGALTAWSTALAYAMQLYFDFSGYSDMAIGLAAVFGLRFPTNFNSPYKSRSVIEFWQRWHMTLSRYLQLLLFSPIALAITRHRVRRGLKVSHKSLKTLPVFMSLLFTPTFITMGLAGVWHGAGLQFLVFGLLHAVYLCVNHAARTFGTGAIATRRENAPWLERLWKIALTFGGVVVAQAFFRASSCTDAVQLLFAMLGGHGGGVSALPHALQLPASAAAYLTHGANLWQFDEALYARLLICSVMVWFLPNTQEILGAFAPNVEPATPARWAVLRWRPAAVPALCIGILLALAVVSLNQSTTFLYFQF